MVNMDMIGRLRNGLAIGGTSTSTAWKEILASMRTPSTAKDGRPSDHSHVLCQDIPVLFFFTGAHAEYHKPEDDADK
jgi:hypothetical protein